MKLSMYEATVPPFIRSLESLAAVLEKAAAHCEAKKIDPAVLVGARLYPDMFPLAKQVQIAADAAKGGSGRIAQVEPPAFEDNEVTFADLVARLRKTVEFLKTLDAAKFEGAEDRTCTWKTRKGEKSMQGMPYLLTHVTPNFNFHLTTAYAILRHNGVEIGKGDFLGTR
ncbi:MAG: DUF1993 domain-containing protein [Betaproteobacteria bacterium]|nr:DUF1993 domain-containing protein [Betaproteobacteria bacterium]